MLLPLRLLLLLQTPLADVAAVPDVTAVAGLGVYRLDTVAAAPERAVAVKERWEGGGSLRQVYTPTSYQNLALKLS